MPAQIPWKKSFKQRMLATKVINGASRIGRGQSRERCWYQHAKVEKPSKEDAHGYADEVVAADVDIGHHGLPSRPNGHSCISFREDHTIEEKDSNIY
jgi:hypothetical protein